MRPVLAILAALVLSTPPADAASPFSDWAAVVISGDNLAAHVDRHTETFDNARRDLARALQKRGFSPANMAEFSVEPRLHPDTAPYPARLAEIDQALRRLTARARGGCLVYLTSHGSTDGAVLGERLVTPGTLADVIDASCRGRPTVAIVSACYSGVFIPALAAPDRLIVTAARRDRSSFGCGEADRYPFFDACVLEALPAATDFLALARRARLCVARRERQEHMAPPSDPQIVIGARFHSPPFAPTS
ncbi:MAG TPA: C13 family peptidase [Caulobacteraceae bacterium]|jgi:hypothetical protein